jgi:hypothetical protein
MGFNAVWNDQLSAAFADAGAIMAIPSAHPDAPTTANNFLIIEDPF